MYRLAVGKVMLIFPMHNLLKQNATIIAEILFLKVLGKNQRGNFKASWLHCDDPNAVCSHRGVLFI